MPPAAASSAGRRNSAGDAMAAALIPTLLGLLLLQPCSGASVRSQRGAGSQVAAQTFLEKYGYFDAVHQGLNPAGLSDAIREFQWISHLPLSGNLDASTLHRMTLPRCGVPDAESHAAWKKRVKALFSGRKARKRRRKRYLPQSGKWFKRHLTYRLMNWPSYLPPQQVRLAVKAAFELWSNVSSLIFWEAVEEPADIRLTFFHGDHNDGIENAFDGPGGALAHAFFPRRGEAHFDNDERWSLGSGKGRNLFVVMAHEVGHTLGLEHSPVPSALMSPYYKKLGKGFVLNWDDILAIQNLYGKPSRGSVVQLPGKLFAHFHDGKWDLESSEANQEVNFSFHYCWSFFDALTVDLENNLYIFKDKYYWIVSKGSTAAGPRLLQAMWPGLPSSIDAAAFLEKDEKFYFFKGGRCWRYKGSSLEVSFPQKCSLTGDLPRHPDTALFFHPLQQLVLFKGLKYYVVSEESLQVEPYYPRSLKDWGEVPAMTNGAVTHQDGFVYFFRKDQFWKFNPEKLEVVETGKWATQLGWLGCGDVGLNQAVA